MRKPYGLKILILFHLAFIKNNAQTAITLKQALISAKLNNPVLKTENFNINIAQADIITAKLRPNPIFSNQSITLIKQNNFFPNTDFANALNSQIWLQLTRQFILPSQRKYKIEVAKQNVNIIKKDIAEKERNLFLNVGNIWVDAWFAKINVNLISKVSANIDSLVYTNKLKIINTNTANIDLTRIQLFSQQLKIQIKSMQNDYNNQLQNLKFVLSTNDSISIDMNDNFFSNEMTIKIDSLINYSSLNRTDVLLAQNNIEKSNYNIYLQKANAKPIPELGVIYNPQNTIPYFGLFTTLSLPIFSRNQGEIQKSKILKAQAEQNLAVLHQQIKTEITIAYNSVQIQKQIVEDYKAILISAEQILNFEKNAYLNGGSIVDYLTAEQTRFETQKLYYESQYYFRKSYIQLLHSTGLIN